MPKKSRKAPEPEASPDSALCENMLSDSDGSSEYAVAALARSFWVISVSGFSGSPSGSACEMGCGAGAGRGRKAAC